MHSLWVFVIFYIALLNVNEALQHDLTDAERANLSELGECDRKPRCIQVFRHGVANKGDKGNKSTLKGFATLWIYRISDTFLGGEKMQSDLLPTDDMNSPSQELGHFPSTKSTALVSLVLSSRHVPFVCDIHVHFLSLFAPHTWPVIGDLSDYVKVFSFKTLISWSVHTLPFLCLDTKSHHAIFSCVWCSHFLYIN